MGSVCLLFVGHLGEASTNRDSLLSNFYAPSTDSVGSEMVVVDLSSTYLRRRSLQKRRLPSVGVSGAVGGLRPWTFAPYPPLPLRQGGACPDQGDNHVRGTGGRPGAGGRGSTSSKKFTGVSVGRGNDETVVRVKLLRSSWARKKEEP